MTAYLDHAATTPMLPVARAAVLEQMERVGNPSSLHTSGRAARSVVEESRERIAGALGAQPSEVIFTSGGTEADNLAVTGLWRARHGAPGGSGRTRIVTSGVEHHAVLDVVEHLVTREGAQATFVEPSECGRIAVADVASALTSAGGPDSVALASVMWANNEVGTIQDIAGMAATAREHGVPFHTDAVQAAGHVPVDFAASGADLMTVTAHKLGGPVGVGALLVRRDVALEPLTFGGGQERKIRSGTLDAPLVAGFAAALDEAAATMATESARVAGLRDDLIRGALALDLGITVTGCWEPGDVTSRLPGNVHLLVPGTQGDSLLYLLDAAGVEVSTGSACQAGVPRPSHVVLALGYTPEQAAGSLRITLGHTSTRADVDALLAALPPAVERARRAAG
ncbi:cysteine desulfurase family protein, partial [Kribbia dieselivorans]|uniref:cysteine desulfurase family protein n=1 Tax=Kribbia dieselivorans TaxID=331526 RepID=UPI000838D836